jgi:hypothetical protein
MFVFLPSLVSTGDIASLRVDVATATTRVSQLETEKATWAMQAEKRQSNADELHAHQKAVNAELRDEQRELLARLQTQTEATETAQRQLQIKEHMLVQVSEKQKEAEAAAISAKAAATEVEDSLARASAELAKHRDGRQCECSCL